MQTRANACCVLLFATACSVLVGCSSKDPEQRASVEGANDRIQALLKNIRTLEDENRQLKADSAARADALKKTYDAQASTVAAANRRSTADLEGKIADLQMELSMSEKQRLALQGVADQPKRLQALQQENLSMERAVWISIVFIAAMVSLWLALRYHSLRKQRRDNIVRVVTELSRLKE